ncbi:hypothetical protein [uncultured Muribaculum sp.]|uniref:hypothetical protein n=1 Tax=uncultured Muribaculum sp. TaxID=1918613 RepID=UPI0025E16CEE|nr:hypothetical protein [uncultured Muribaculum sp.]
MKHKLLHLQSLVSVALCVIMSMVFVGCGDDDDEPNGTDLAEIVVGTWAQDGDNDILTVNANGSGVGYDNPTAYQNNQVGYSFNWSYGEGWVNITFDIDGELQLERMRAKSVSQNIIVWQRYAIPTEDYDPSEDEWDGHDSFGYYDLWTWERYK